MRIVVYIGKLSAYFLCLSYEIDFISIGYRYNNKWCRGNYERPVYLHINSLTLFNFGDEE